MYESFYGLSAKPFQLNPDPSFYFGSTQHRRATAYLEYGLHQNEGFIVVTGEVGAGKTTIVRGLLDKLDSAKVVAAHLVSTQMDADDILRVVAAAFGLRTKNIDKSDILLALEAFLVDVTRQGKRCLLVVDEAQNLRPRAVEELRMLSNFQLETHALLQSFLIGQPEFREVMRSPHMQQLRQRVIAACHLGPMDQDETRGYIEHRLKCAGSKGIAHFFPDAYQAIYEASGGIPRRINTVCDRLLLSGFLAGKTVFTREDVDTVAREISEETSGPSTPARPGDAAWQAGVQSGSDGGVDVDLSSLALDPAAADAAARLLEGLQGGQVEERLMRLESGLHRLERSNGAVLALLQQLVDAARSRPNGKENQS